MQKQGGKMQKQGVDFEMISKPTPCFARLKAQFLLNFYFLKNPYGTYALLPFFLFLLAKTEKSCYNEKRLQERIPS